jgi:cyclophilin family peptidyl-prolyl cis-trans isomerase
MPQCLFLVLLGLTTAAAAQTAQPTQTTKKPPTVKVMGTPAQKTVPVATVRPTAVIHTTAGDLKCELFPDKAPKAVANFIGLATGTKDWTNPATGQVEHNHPLYDGVIFHRVIPGFMIQGGDPLGQGTGGPGYKFEDELSRDLLFDQPGRLAMANSGVNTNGSQFFITEQATPFLNPCFDEGGCMGGRRPQNSGYTIFGQCDSNSVELVKKIALGPCQGGQVCNGNNSRPENPVRIEHIDILNAGKQTAAKPAAKKTTRKTKTGTTTKKKSSTPQ